jgi:hypothetical protein
VGQQKQAQAEFSTYNAVMRQIRPFGVATLALAATGLGLLAIPLRNCGNFLVVDNREKSDAIVITQADSLDAAYWMGLHLLTDGYGREMHLDARTNRIYFGRSQAEWAGDSSGIPLRAFLFRSRFAPSRPTPQLKRCTK